MTFSQTTPHSTDECLGLLSLLMDLPPCKRQSMPTEPTLNEEDETRPWADLPPDLLSPIANSLGLIDLLSFRATCKGWHSASSTASAQVESSPHRKPWFLLRRENSQCSLYNESNKKWHAIEIPELQGAICLASNYGWVLLSKEGSLFFFCPFSRAKIDLPKFPHGEPSDHIAALSAPPTSEECIVCMMNRKGRFLVELNVLSRGAETWTKIDYECGPEGLSTAIGTAYDEDEGTFYFLDGENRALTYSVKKKTWVRYIIVDRKQERATHDECLPFTHRSNYLRSAEFYDSELKTMSISTCGTVVPGCNYDMIIFSECVPSSTEPHDQKPALKGIWIQPRFLQVPSNQSW